jgi:hypothetical protein
VGGTSGVFDGQYEFGSLWQLQFNEPIGQVDRITFTGSLETSFTATE